MDCEGVSDWLTDCEVLMELDADDVTLCDALGEPELVSN